LKRVHAFSQSNFDNQDNKLNYYPMNNLFEINKIEKYAKAIALCCLFFLFGTLSYEAAAQCANDVTPPVPVCKPAPHRDVKQGGTRTVDAAFFNNGSYDNCSTNAALQFFVETGAPSPTHPTTTTLTFSAAQAGLIPIVLWVVDSVGNAAHCSTTLELSVCQSAISMVCNDLIKVYLDTNNTAVIVPGSMLEGGPYCDYTVYHVQIDPNAGGPPSAPSITVSPANIGLHIMKVIDTSTGNACWGNVDIIGQSPCPNDVLPPVADCKSPLVVEANSQTGYTTLPATAVNDASSDDCTTSAHLQYFIQLGTPGTTPPWQISVTFNNSQPGSYPVVLWVVDEAGNYSHCQTVAQVTLCQTAAMVCNDSIVIDLGPSGVAPFTKENLLVPGTYCNNDNFDVGLDGLVFGPSMTLTTQNLGYHVGTVSGFHNNVSLGTCWGVVQVIQSTSKHILEGTVFSDNNHDCLRQDSVEAGMQNWIVKAVGLISGHVFVANTDAQGHYSMLVDPSEPAYTVSLDAAYNYGGADCNTSYTVNFPILSGDDTVHLEIPVQLDTECPRMVISIVTPKIRPCFSGTYYVHYSNVSTQSIANTFVDVTLDPYLSFISSSSPADSLGNHIYRVQTGYLTAGQSGSFALIFFTDCAAPLGITHCSEAHIFPDTICPNSPFWSGAVVSVEGACQNDSIFLKIKNIGTAPTQTLDYTVIEDVLMREMGSFSLAAGAKIDLNPIPGNGATFRLQAEQEPGYPYGGAPAVWVEGCAGLTPGMVTLFQTNNNDPFDAVHCIENTSSFDPNDKHAEPKGYGSAHYIDNNTVLDYTVRFQNTGTDTAFQVVILDTLSSFLNTKMIETGAASHPYRFELLNGNVLRFTFDGIQLPDSNANFAASQGFIQFRIPQTPDNPDGTIIENSAAIYFDFNTPVITNYTHHEVGSHFITVTNVHTAADRAPMKVYPNPAGAFVYFDAPYASNEALQFTLTDLVGRVVETRKVPQLPMRWERGNLAAGTYFFRFAAGEGVIWTGKVVVR
jgi:uncharacterized repeat protein (TIGR01451 family)